MTRWLETDSLSNQNIASGLAIGAYTADADRLILCQFFADQVAGNGDYDFWLTHQIAGSGSSYRYVPKTTATVASGVTAIAGQSIMVAVRSGDVLTAYLDGLAGDTTTPDTTVRWFEMAALRPATADRTIAVDASGNVDLVDAPNATAVAAVVAAIDADPPGVDVASISGDAVAADNLEAMLDGTRAKLYLSQLNVVAAGNDAAFVATGAGAGQGILVTGGATAEGLKITTNSAVAGVAINALSGHGISVAAGKVGLNIYGNDADGGHSAVDIYNNGTTADAVRIDHLGGGKAVNIRGSGSEPAVEIHHYGSAEAMKIIGGDTSGDAVLYQTTNGHGISFDVSGAGKNDVNTDELARTGADGDTLETLSDQIDGISAGGATAQEVWEYTTRTLTQSSTSTSDSTAAGSIARRRGDSWSISLTIGAITGYTSLWFTAKWDRDDTDISSVLQIKLNSPSASDGLLYVNGAAASDSAKGSITVSDDTTGAIIIAVDETITQYLPPAGLYYDIQVLNSGTVTTPDSGTLTITADVTRDVA